MTVQKSTNRWYDRSDPPGGSSPSSGTAVLFAVQNVAELSVLTTADMENGSAVSMRSVLDLWLLDRDSSATPDGITIVAAFDGGGNWVRAETASAEWRSRSVWYINSSTGNDENDGGVVGAPLKTFEELWRRTMNNPLYGGGAVVHVLGATYMGDINLNVDVGSVGPGLPNLSIVGTVSAPLFTGAITTLQNWDIATQKKQLITAAALPVSWTASGLVGKRIVLTSGPNAGAWAQVLVDLGGKQAFVGPFWDPGAFAVITPAVAQTFEVVDVTQVNGTTFSGGNGFTMLQDLRFNSSNNADITIEGGGVISAMGCESVGFAGPSANLGFASWLGCYFATSPNFEMSSGHGASFNFWGCSFTSVSLAARGGTVTIQDLTCIQGVRDISLLVDSRGFAQVDGPGLAIFDGSTAGGTVTVQASSALEVPSPIWGNGNNDAWHYSVTGGSKVIGTPITNFVDLVGTPTSGFDTRIGGVTKNYAGIPYVELATLCCITTDT